MYIDSDDFGHSKAKWFHKTRLGRGVKCIRKKKKTQEKINPDSVCYNAIVPVLKENMFFMRRTLFKVTTTVPFYENT